MNMKMNTKPDDNKVTREEFRNIVKAMDRDGFENIMDEYVKEISDPNNVAESNQFLKQAEQTNDLPKNVKLAEPKKGFVIRSEKFSMKRPALRQKVYINICTLDQVKPPKEESNNMWSLPHLLNKGRNDQDRKGNLCTTFDIIFNPEAVRLANQSIAFKKFVCDTSVNGINNNILKTTQEKISNDYVIKKYEYKGKEVALININSLVAGDLDSRMEPTEEHKTSMMKEIDKMKEKKDEENEESEFDKPDVVIDESILKKEQYPLKPKYKIKYSDEFELHKFFYNPMADAEAQYKKLIIDIEVPLLDNLNEAQLELDTKKLSLRYKEIYSLELELPSEIDKDKSNAKFDRKSKTLTISALIVKKTIEVPKLKEDENIEIITEEMQEEERRQEKAKKEAENNEVKKVDAVTEEKIKPEVPALKKEEEVAEIKREMLEIKNEIVNSEEVKEESLVKKENKLVTEIVKDMKEVKDEDDLPEESRDNQVGYNNNQNEENKKISYFNFNCDMIYEID